MSSETVSQYKFGFLAANLFQAEQMVEFCRSFKGNGWLICRPEIASKIRASHDDIQVTGNLRKSLFWRNEVAQYDGHFDVLVAHHLFRGFERLRKTRVAMIQYGYGKSVYNYGSWRALADLNLVYGPHAANAIEIHSPVRVVGHPKQKLVTKPNPPLSSSRLRVLYAPTWDKLSSIDDWADDVSLLATSHDVTVCPHHNTVLYEPDRMVRLRSMGVQVVCDKANLIELICENDVVVSDYSGAIFEAILADKPIVLVDIEPAKVRTNRKIGSNSLEIAYRSEIGVVAESGKLAQAVISAANVKVPTGGINRAMLFTNVDDPATEIVKALEELASGQIIPNDKQLSAQRFERERRIRGFRKRMICRIAFLTAFIVGLFYFAKFI